MLYTAFEQYTYSKAGWYMWCLFSWTVHCCLLVFIAVSSFSSIDKLLAEGSWSSHCSAQPFRGDHFLNLVFI